MINNFEVIIGIEVHVVLNTKTKMFSPSLNSHHYSPNTLVNEIDLGLPGILPSPNSVAIKKGIWLAKALKANINYSNIKFDRKNYYYLDLPKGYQITQQYFPIGENGKIVIDNNGISKTIKIQRLHLEEDTAKQISKDNKLLLDFNRSGCPLIEIVTYPDIRNENEACEYLNKLIQILKFNEISDAKLEDGSLRADINISIRPFGQKEFNNKVEIKNINSINNVAKAINFEINRQTELLLNNQEVIQETRRFDDNINQTVSMRKKDDAVDYCYFYEPNIVTIKITQPEFEQILKEKNKDLDEIVDDLQNIGLSESNINQLLNNYELYKLFNNINSSLNEPIMVFNWLAVELAGLIKKHNDDFNNISKEKINEIINMLMLLKQQDINGKQAKVIIEEIYLTSNTTQEIIKKNNFEQIKDETILSNIIEKLISENQNMVDQYQERPERVEKFFVGLVMKETKSQANPQITMNLVLKLLGKVNKNR